MIEVTQADRNAAKNMDRQNLLGCYLEEHIDRGDYDHVPAIQQFATHRIEAARLGIIEGLEMAEQAVSQALAFGAREAAVRAIRALIEEQKV